jgi:hypothetical protein
MESFTSRLPIVLCRDRHRHDDSHECSSLTPPQTL